MIYKDHTITEEELEGSAGDYSFNDGGLYFTVENHNQLFDTIEEAKDFIDNLPKGK